MGFLNASTHTNVTRYHDTIQIKDQNVCSIKQAKTLQGTITQIMKSYDENLINQTTNQTSKTKFSRQMSSEFVIERVINIQRDFSLN